MRSEKFDNNNNNNNDEYKKQPYCALHSNFGKCYCKGTEHIARSK